MKQIIFLFLLLISLISYFTYDYTLKLFSTSNEENQVSTQTNIEKNSDIKDIKILPIVKEVIVEDKKDIEVEDKKVETKLPIEEKVIDKKVEIKKPNLEKIEQIAKKIEPKEEVTITRTSLNTTAIQEQINAILKNNKITFKRLSSDITDDSYKSLEDIAKLLKENGDIKIEVGGHTDAKGKDDVNKWVSQQRAKSVRKELIKFGISKDRITAVGYGETMPLVPNNKNGYAAENRRVEFKVIEE